MKLSTKLKNGCLFYLTGINPTHYLVLFITNSKLHVQFEFGRSEILTFDDEISTGQFFDITVTMQETKLYASILGNGKYKQKEALVKISRDDISKNAVIGYQSTLNTR